MSEIRRRHPNFVSLVASDSEGDRLLARGAAIHARELSEDRVSYLDTLPEMELFVARAGNFEWLQLLQDENPFVQGGKEWNLAKPIHGLTVPRGATRLKLAVAHEEYKGVREIAANLDRSAEHRLPARLHVSCTPAQGNARLRVVTEPVRNIPEMSVLANWSQMVVRCDDQGIAMDKQKYLDSQPRSFPELMPRRSSRKIWRLAVRDINQLLERLRTYGASDVMAKDWLLRTVKDRLMQKDQSQMPHDATAIGSDGIAPFRSDVLAELTAALLTLWRDYRNDLGSPVNTIVRALGYLSVDNEEFEQWLIDNPVPGYSDSQCVLHSSGLALRYPKRIATFIARVFQRNTPGSNELKAVSQVLRYRSLATRDIPTHDAERIVRVSLGVFEKGMRRGGRGYPFRWSSLVVVYMLRRRMHDIAFMDPNEQLGVDAKELFYEAISLMEQGKLRPMAGTVNVPQALRQMIDYIDRKGHGEILMAAEEA